MHPDIDLSFRQLKEVRELFNEGSLMVGHGSLVMGGITSTYNLSTVVGMSGSPVLMDGRLTGIYLLFISIF